MALSKKMLFVEILVLMDFIMTLQKSQVIDYVDGLEALNNSEIRMIGKPIERFEEDPVRMIRAIRFSKLN